MNELDAFLYSYNEVVSIAFEIIYGLDSKISVVPTDYGTILFEDSYLNNYLSIEIRNTSIEVIYIKEMDIKQVSTFVFVDDLVKTSIDILNNFHKGDINVKQFK